MKGYKYLIVILTFTLLLFSCSHQTATIKEIKKTFTTYMFSDPDPVAHPARNIYPYFRFDGYEKEPEQKEWKVIEMENPYVKVHIFPEIGGKIWGAIEKSTGNEFIYYNSVVKFRNIAMRGPWTSGGIEFNFGIIGHSPHVSTPVDYAIRENDDKSVSCFVGGYEFMTRTRWETEINLQPDKAYFTTKTRYINQSQVLQPYYQWSNAAFQAEGDLEMIFKGNHRIGHGGEANDWPMDEQNGNLSFYSNNKTSDASNHIVGSVDGFYAAYWHDLNFGSGNYSLFGDKLGKKIFLWSQARSGGIWEDLLTDSDGQYVELQTGRLFNQAATGSTRTPYKHFGFLPNSADEFTECWFPVLNIGGVSKANYLGALNVVKKNGEQSVYFSPLQHFKDEIKIYFGDDLKYTFKIDKNPLEIWEETIPLNAENEFLKIVAGTGETLIYTEDVLSETTSRPVKAPEDFDWNSVHGLYTDGVNWIYQGHFDRAFQSLEACLKKDACYTPALNHLAELCFRKADFEKALGYLKRSLAVNTYDPKANFLYGLVNKHTNQLVDSRDGFAVATLSPEYRIPAFLELAKLFLLRNELPLAGQYVDRILAKEADNQNAVLLKAIISRKTGLVAEANHYTDRLEAISPLNHFARAEKMFLKPSNTTTQNFTSLVRNELPYQTFLEMAGWYNELGCRGEAIQILELSPENALIHLLLSYFHQNNSEKSLLYFDKFIRDKPDFIFPFRLEMLPVLEWASQKSSDWKPEYYLGLLHWHLGNREQAKLLFEECKDLPDAHFFYLAREELLISEKSYNPENDLKKALKLGKNDWRTSLAMIDFHLSKDMVSDALEISKKSLELFPNNDVLQYNYAKCLLANGFYSECLNELENIVILPNEGARYGRITYRQAAIMESLRLIDENKYEEAMKSVGKARLWPENLGVGRPFLVDERIEDFLEAECLLKLNEKEKAQALFRKIIDFTQQRTGRHNSVDYVFISAAKRMGMSHLADGFMREWEEKSPTDPVLKWTKAMSAGNKTAALQIEKEISTGSEGTPWDPRYSDSEFELVKRIANQVN
jgi:tetratricopeptide (TPR) repeat protein